MPVRREIAEFLRTCDILLNKQDIQFTDTELELLKAYMSRMDKKLKFPESAA